MRELERSEACPVRSHGCSAMKLAYSPSSPFVRKVMVVLHETGQIDEVAIEPATLDPYKLSEALLAVNPVAKVPTLVLDDGSTVCDSRTICAYFNDRVGGALYGEGRALWAIRTLEAMADEITNAGFNMRMETRFRPQEKQLPAWLDALWQRVAHGCAGINADWMELLHAPLNAGQIAVGCCLGYLDARHDERNWRACNVDLARWYEGFSKRTSMQLTQPVG